MMVTLLVLLSAYLILGNLNDMWSYRLSPLQALSEPFSHISSVLQSSSLETSESSLVIQSEDSSLETSEISLDSSIDSVYIISIYDTTSISTSVVIIDNNNIMNMTVIEGNNIIPVLIL